ncbi:MAG TPA: hypothetical protein VIX19_01995 [Terriglobales bacterium]
MYPTSKKLMIAATAALALLLALEMPAQQSVAGDGGTATNTGQSDPQTQPGQQQRRPNVMTYLNLTVEQKGEWLRIQRETAKSIHAARVDDSLNEEQMQQKIKEIHSEQRRQLLALLTPQQQEALKQWWEEQKQQKAREKGTDSPSGPGASTTAGAANDDYFAGMVQDDPDSAPAKAAQTKAPPKN